MAEGGALDDWVNGVQPSIAGFAGYDYPDGIRLDFTAGTLPKLVEQARRTLVDADDVFDEHNRDYVLAVMAYLGESLLKTVGGYWDWDDNPGFAERGQPAVDNATERDAIVRDYWGWPDSPVGSPSGLPIIVPDPDLRLPPLSPLHLLLAGIGPRGDGVWARTRDDWIAVADSHRAANPHWSPTPTQTPGFGAVQPPPESDVLDLWLRRRVQAFPGWAAAHPGTFDFTEQSLDGLNSVITARITSEEQLAALAHREFVEGAVWYFGETMCRGARTARWLHQPDRVGPSDPDLVAFTVQRGDGQVTLTPYWTFAKALTEPSRTPRSRFIAWHK